MNPCFERWGSDPLAASHSPLHAGLADPAGVISLIIPVDIDVNQLAILGKKYLWQKPSACPRCGGHLWWHGFVLAYPACLAEAVFFRRLLCPHCRSVHRLRPKSYWRRFQSSVATIEQVIAHRQNNGRWSPDLPRPRQRQWWRRLQKKSLLCLGLSFVGSLFDSFLTLIEAGAIPVNSVMECDDG